MRGRLGHGPFARLGLVIALGLAVYALGVIGNGFWGYSDADAAAICTTSTAGYQTCVDKTCWATSSSGSVTCSTTTTVCAPGGMSTGGSRNCVTTTNTNTCTTDSDACRPTPGGSLNSCTTTTAGWMTCVSTYCSSDSGGARTCMTTTVTCSPATSGGARTCTTSSVRVNCTSVGFCPPRPPTDGGGTTPPPGGGGGGGSGGGAGASSGHNDGGASGETVGDQQQPPVGTSSNAGAGSSQAPAPPRPTMTVEFGDTGTLVLRGTTVKVTSAQLKSGRVPIGTASCDGAQRSCRFTTSGKLAGRSLRSATVSVPVGARRAITLKLKDKERRALRRGHRLRATLTVAASADGAQAIRARRTITIQSR